MFVPQFNIVTIGLCLIRCFRNELECFKGTGFDAGLFAAGTALFVPVGSRINAQVAFGGFSHGLQLRIPNGPVRLLWAHFDAGFAADAFIAVDPSNVTVLGVDIGSAHRAINDARWRDALPAWCHFNIIRELSERVLHNLDARQGQTVDAIVGERTGEHACCAACAFFAVVDKIALRNRNCLLCGRCWGRYRRNTGNQCIDGDDGSSSYKKIASRILFVVNFFAFSFFASRHRVTPSLDRFVRSWVGTLLLRLLYFRIVALGSFILYYRWNKPANRFYVVGDSNISKNRSVCAKRRQA